MLNGHVDVVPPGDPQAWSTDDPFSGRIAGDVLYGRGACDMKAGLVAAMFAVRAVRRAGAPLRGDLLLACVPGEEDGGLGTYGMLRRGWRADACVIPEPTSLDLVPANAGALTFRLRVPGHATHASRRTEGVSAVEKFLPVLARARATRGAAQHRRRPADASLADRLPAVHRHGPGRRLGLDGARPAGGGRAARRRARRAGRECPGRARGGGRRESAPRTRGCASTRSPCSGGAGSSRPGGCPSPATSPSWLPARTRRREAARRRCGADRSAVTSGC